MNDLETLRDHAREMAAKGDEHEALWAQIAEEISAYLGTSEQEEGLF